MRYLTGLLLIVSFLNLYAQHKEKKELLGNYEYFEENLIGFDNCCRLKWELKLRADSTFNLDIRNDQGDYIQDEYSTGVYRVKANVVYLFSKISKESKKLEIAKESIPDSLLKISFENRGTTMGYIWTELNGRHFYSLDKNYERKLLEPIYTLPDKSKVNLTKGYDNIEVGLKPNDFESISFFFRRDSIEDFLLCEINETDYTESAGFLFSLKDFSENNYLIRANQADQNLYKDKDFIDVSTYKFVIRNSYLISQNKFNNGVGKLTHVKLKRKK